jgi:hypothetical protein
MSRKFLLIAMCFLTLFTNAQKKEKTRMLYCGFSFTSEELQFYEQQCKEQQDAEKADTVWNILLQVKDSLKIHLPAEWPFEVKLVMLTDELFGVDVYIPLDEEWYETVACVVLDAAFNGKIPDQCYLRVYSRTKEENTHPFLFAVKRRRK